MRLLKRALLVLPWVVILPVPAYAQATLAGVVKDTSGAILPGVTVEAASPVLIEQVRTAVTDGTGQYRITELPPGPYSLTFRLTPIPAWCITQRSRELAKAEHHSHAAFREVQRYGRLLNETM